MSHFFKKCTLLTLTGFLLTASYSEAQTAATSDDSVLKSAIEKGKLAAEYWVKKSGINPSTTDYYADICSFYGACLFGEANKDSSFYREINSKYTRTTAIKTDNIDNNSCGILPLHLYLHNNKADILQLGTNAANANIQKNGHFRNAVDDTYMTGSLLIQAYRATDKASYLDFCVDFILKYMGNLIQSNGLYWHHGDISKQFWGRGNGWGAASVAELIQVIPETHPKYAQVIAGYKKHMDGLIKVQRESGMWPQLLASTDSRNWEESSGTSMFVFALFTGLELGLLDKNTYLAPAVKGWTAVAKQLGSDGKLNNIAAGFWPQKGTADEYLTASKAAAGNSHGTAGFLWAATSVIRYYNATKTCVRYCLTPYQSNRLKSSEVTPCFNDLMGRSQPVSSLTLSSEKLLPPIMLINRISSMKTLTIK